MNPGARRLAVAAGLGAGVALAVAGLGEGRATLGALARFPSVWLPLLLAGALGNYALRFLRWHFYLRALGIALGGGASLLVFLAGLGMALSPGKLGEVLKAVLVRELTGVPAGRTTAAVVAERLTDVAGLILLSLLGATAIPGGPWVLGGLALALVLALALLRSRGLAGLLERAAAHRRLAGLGEPVRAFLGGGRALLTPGRLVAAVALSVGAWGGECLALWVALLGLGAPARLREAAFVYAFASLAGAVSMLPGGLGAAEASLTGLLVALGVGLPVAAAATLLVRLCTLWFGAALGAATLALAFRRRPRLPPTPVLS